MRGPIGIVNTFLGPSLGGTALALGGVGCAMGLNVLLFGLATAAAFRLSEPAFAARHRAASTWLGEMAAGLQAKWGVPLDRWWTAVGALMMVFLLPMTGMLLPLRIQSLGLSPAWFGACGAALSLGLLLGVLSLADALIRRLGRARAIALAVLLCGASAGAIGLCSRAPGLALCFGLIGLGMSVTQLVGQTHRMLAIPENFRARMSAAQLTASHVAAALAPALAGAMLQHWPVETVYLLMAMGFLLSGLLLLAVPGLGHFLALSHEEVRNWYGHQHPQAFAGARPQSPKSTNTRKPS